MNFWAKRFSNSEKLSAFVPPPASNSKLKHRFKIIIFYLEAGNKFIKLTTRTLKGSRACDTLRRTTPVLPTPFASCYRGKQKGRTLSSKKSNANRMDNWCRRRDSNPHTLAG